MVLHVHAEDSPELREVFFNLLGCCVLRQAAHKHLVELLPGPIGVGRPAVDGLAIKHLALRPAGDVSHSRILEGDKRESPEVIVRVVLQLEARDPTESLLEVRLHRLLRAGLGQAAHEDLVVVVVVGPAGVQGPAAVDGLAIVLVAFRGKDLLCHCLVFKQDEAVTSEVASVVVLQFNAPNSPKVLEVGSEAFLGGGVGKASDKDLLRGVRSLWLEGGAVLLASFAAGAARGAHAHAHGTHAHRGHGLTPHVHAVHTLTPRVPGVPHTLAPRALAPHVAPLVHAIHALAPYAHAVHTLAPPTHACHACAVHALASCAHARNASAHASHAVAGHAVASHPIAARATASHAAAGHAIAGHTHARHALARHAHASCTLAHHLHAGHALASEHALASCATPHWLGHDAPDGGSERTACILARHAA
mmetsp:Transcript_90345/g.292425  ORF Transcript_90345/g.292425 Transcript_90345/m.292425 type:complete len:421 (+) Transcript_90345:1253-2515(+)